MKIDNSYTLEGEWTSVTVSASRTGWIVESHSCIAGDRTGVRVLLPYDETPYPNPDQALDADHNDFTSVAGHLAALAALAVGRVLRKGFLVE